MHRHACETLRPVRRDRRRGGLLQRLVGEQPLRGVVELGCSPAAQRHRLDQHRGSLTEPCSRCCHVGDQRRGTQLEATDLTERLPPGFAAQEAHIVEAERYDDGPPGLTPVTMTL